MGLYVIYNTNVHAYRNAPKPNNKNNEYNFLCILNSKFYPHKGTPYHNYLAP